MIRPALFAGCAAIVVALASAGRAETVTVGNVAFEKPAAALYEQKSANGGMLFQHKIAKPGGESGGVVIAVGTMASPAAAFDGAFAKLADGIKEMAGQKSLAQGQGIASNGMPARWMLRCCRGNSEGGASMSMTLVAFQDKETLVYAELLTINVDHDNAEPYDADFDRLVASLAFDGGQPRPAVPPAPPTGSEALSGLFLNVSNQITPNPFGGTDFRVNLDTYFFDPSGYVASEPPYGASGIADFCGRHASDCGTYQVTGGQIALSMASKRFGVFDTKTAAFAHDGAALKIGDRAFNPVEPAHDLKLAGSWTYFWASAGSTATSSGSVSSSHTIVFSADGHFKRTGFTGVSSANESGGTTTGVTAGSPSAEQSGTYKIDGYTLSLTFSDGKTESDSIYLPDKADTKLLVIDGDNYLSDAKQR